MFKPAPAGGYVASCPALRMMAAGNTLPEVRSTAATAIRDYVQGRLESGCPVPPSQYDQLPATRRGVILEPLTVTFAWT